MPVFLQILLSVVIMTLTILVAAAGIQVFHILHEVRQALQKINNILKNTDTLAASSAKPVAAVNAFFSEVKNLVSQTEDSLISSAPDRVISSADQPTVHSDTRPASLRSRFFRRSGAPLRPS